MQTKLFTRLTGALCAALFAVVADAPARTVAVSDPVGDAPSKGLDIKSAKATKTDGEVTFTVVLAGKPSRSPRKVPVIDLDTDNNRDANWYLGLSGDGTSAGVFDYDDPTREIAPATATIEGTTVTYTVKVRRIRTAHWRAATYGRGVAPGSTDQVPNVNYLKMPA
jgi:hypothetical protein